MDNQLLSLITAVVGLSLGVLITWLLTKSKTSVAKEQGKAEVAIELAMANERVRSIEAERDKLSNSQIALQTQANEWRDTLDQARDDLAKLNERATRIPVLDEKVAGLENALTDVGQQTSELREANSRTTAELKAERETLAMLRSEHQAEKTQRLQAETRVNSLTTELAEMSTNLNSERNQAQEKLALLIGAKEDLSNQFKSLANDILEEKSKRFTEQNQTNIGQLLNPLKDRMMEFKAKVEEIHTKDTEQQAMLKAELAQLKDLNLQMTEEAHSLATALKGQAKKQGNWGELILGNVLDRSGLREGKDFKREVSFNTEEGRKRPDVVIYLPQSKHLVIDAKVSLNAYTRYVNAEDDIVRKQAMQEHVSAVASRIQELSNRSYFDLPGLNSPEMVFMFIPIESAFVEALRADENLFQKAIEQNVLVATPTTLLTSLNIVRQLWRFEEQNAHTAELADRAGKVYKKLVTFLGSMEAVGHQLDKAKESFGTAMGQLYTGKGNLISQAKEFEKLGVSVQTPLPEHLVAKAALELEHLPEITDDTALETNES
jgi:DNA recombination protein RmuC